MVKLCSDIWYLKLQNPISERICYADILFCRYNGSIIRNKCIDHKIQTGKILVIYPAISLVMLALVYMIKTPMICYVGAFVIGYAAAGGVLQMATAVVNDLFPKIKGTITSLVMIASSLCNYTILTAAAKMTSTSVIMMNIVITAIGILLALFVNVRYGVLLKNAEEASKN